MKQANNNQPRTIGSDVLQSNVKDFNCAAERLLNSLKAVEDRLLGILPEPFEFKLVQIHYKNNVLTSRAGVPYGPALIHDEPGESWGHPLPPSLDLAGETFFFEDDPLCRVTYCNIEQMWVMAQRIPEMIEKISDYLTRSAERFNETTETLDRMAAATTEPAETRCPVCGALLANPDVPCYCVQCGTPTFVDHSLLVMCPACDRANNPLFPTCYHCGEPMPSREVDDPICECTTLQILQKIGSGRFTGGAKYGICPVCDKRIASRGLTDIADPHSQVPPMIKRIPIE